MNDLTRKQFVSGAIKVLAVSVLSPNFGLATGTSTSQYPSCDRSVDSLVEKLSEQGIDVRPVVKDARFYPKISNLFPTSEKKESVRKFYERLSPEKRTQILEASVADYKRRTGFDTKCKEIHRFMYNNSYWLDKSVQEYVVPKELTSAVIGIESSFGAYPGKLEPAGVLVSLYRTAEDDRAEWAAKQLAGLATFTMKKRIHPKALKSSHAAAIGHAQFIPTSLNTWFVGNNVYDMADCIMSAANYLSQHSVIYGSLEGAVFGYNHWDVYVQTVLDLAYSAGMDKAARIGRNTPSLLRQCSEGNTSRSSPQIFPEVLPFL
ncbi:MAG: lytic murein transglycosylase [Candidatus Woesearchaeota archaeon]